MPLKFSLFQCETMLTSERQIMKKKQKFSVWLVGCEDFSVQYKIIKGIYLHFTESSMD